MTPPNHSPIKFIQGWLYTLTNLGRRVIGIMLEKLRELRLSKEVLFSALGVLVSLIVTWPFILATLPTMFKPHGWIQMVGAILGGWVIIVFFIRCIWREIRRIDKAIGAKEEKVATKRDEPLVSALSALNKTLQALQEQNKVIATTLERLVQKMEDGKID